MALSITQAHAVNHLLGFFLTAPGPSGPVSSEAALKAAQALAGKAWRVLMAGLTPEQVAELFAGHTAAAAEIERLRAELADWRDREHQQEYALVGPDGDPNDADPVSERAADLALERPDLGTPWVRTVTTSRWERYTPTPADEPTPEQARLRVALRETGERMHLDGCCTDGSCSICQAERAALQGSAEMVEAAYWDGDTNG